MLNGSDNRRPDGRLFQLPILFPGLAVLRGVMAARAIRRFDRRSPRGQLLHVKHVPAGLVLAETVSHAALRIEGEPVALGALVAVVIFVGVKDPDALVFQQQFRVNPDCLWWRNRLLSWFSVNRTGPR